MTNTMSELQTLQLRVAHLFLLATRPKSSIRLTTPVVHNIPDDLSLYQLIGKSDNFGGDLFPLFLDYTVVNGISHANKHDTYNSD